MKPYSLLLTLSILLFLTSCNTSSEDDTPLYTSDDVEGYWYFYTMDIKGFDGEKEYHETYDTYDIEADSAFDAFIVHFTSDSISFSSESNTSTERFTPYVIDSLNRIICHNEEGTLWSEGVVSLKGDSLIIIGTEYFGNLWEAEHEIYRHYKGNYPPESWDNE